VEKENEILTRELAFSVLAPQTHTFYP
jgi:hypothetical protein